MCSLLGAGGFGNDLFCDLAIGLDNDLVDFDGGLDRLGLVVDPFELFEGTALGLDTVVKGVSTKASFLLYMLAVGGGGGERNSGKDLPKDPPQE